MNNGTLVRLVDVHKVYRTGEMEVPAVRGVSLEIKQGEFVALMGASGSGKSTLMNTLGCLDRPTGGSYRLAGEEVGKLGPDHPDVATDLINLAGLLVLNLDGLRDQLLAGLNAVERALAQAFEKEVIDHKAQVGLACTVVGQRGTRLTVWQLFEQFLDELEQVIHLLELATRVLVDLALTREDVQRLEQFDRLPRTQVKLGTEILRLGRSRRFVFGHT